MSTSAATFPDDRVRCSTRRQEKRNGFSDLTFTLSILIAALLLVNIGCRGNAKKVAQSSRDLAASITRSLVSQAGGANPSDPVEEQRVYLDASLSMKGFVNPTNHSKFDELLDGIGDVMPGCQLYKYGQNEAIGSASRPPVTERAYFGLELHQPGFYNLSYNPDDILIDQLASEERSVLSVVITDGVYSEPKGATSPPVVQAIQRWMERGRTFGILVFKSSFSGPLYSERSRSFLPNPSATARPFYAFVFSPTVKGFRELQEKLRARFPEMQSIFFSDGAIKYTLGLQESAKGTYSYRKPPEVPYHWQMFDAELFKQSNPAKVGFHLSYSVMPDYPVTEFHMESAAEYYRWERGGQFKKAESGPPTGFQITTALDGEKENASQEKPQAGKKPSSLPLNVFAAIPKDTGSDYGFYHLKFTPAVKSMKDFSDLSTRDDRVPKDANKTFRFSEFVTALTHAHFKARIGGAASPSLFVTVENH